MTIRDEVSDYGGSKQTNLPEIYQKYVLNNMPIADEKNSSRNNNQANDIIKRYAAISVFKGQSTQKDSLSKRPRLTNKTTLFNQTISSNFNPNIDVNTVNSFFKAPSRIDEQDEENF